MKTEKPQNEYSLTRRQLAWIIITQSGMIFLLIGIIVYLLITVRHEGFVEGVEACTSNYRSGVWTT